MNTGSAIRSGLSTAALAAILIVPAWASEAKVLQEVGGVNMVRIWATGTPPAESKRELIVENRVYLEETVETVRDGALHINFLDDSSFRLGSNSRARLDRFIFDPDLKTGALTIFMSKGVARFVTGKLKGQDIVIRTPAADISVRGTILTIFVALDGTTFVSVLEGAAEMTSRFDSTRVQVTPGGANGRAPTDGSAEPFAGEVGAGDTGIEAGEGFETESTVETENSGTGEGDTQTMQQSTSSGQTPAAVSPTAVFDGTAQAALSLTEITRPPVPDDGNDGSTMPPTDKPGDPDDPAEIMDPTLPRVSFMMKFDACLSG